MLPSANGRTKTRPLLNEMKNGVNRVIVEKKSKGTIYLPAVVNEELLPALLLVPTSLYFFIDLRHVNHLIKVAENDLQQKKRLLTY